MFLERNTYRMVIHAAVEALEKARVTLATAIQRLNEEALDRIEKDEAASHGAVKESL